MSSHRILKIEKVVQKCMLGSWLHDYLKKPKNHGFLEKLRCRPLLRLFRLKKCQKNIDFSFFLAIRHTAPENLKKSWPRKVVKSNKSISRNSF